MSLLKKHSSHPPSFQKNLKSMCNKLSFNIISSLAREAIRVLREENKLKAFNEAHSKYCCYIKTENFVVPEKKEAAPAKGEKKGKQQ